MEIITMILSGLALLAATMCLILIIRAKKRNEKRNAAMAALFRAECSSIIGSVTGYIAELRKIDKPAQDVNFLRIQEVVDVLQNMSPVLDVLLERNEAAVCLERMESILGILQTLPPVLDAAVSAMNDCKGRIENLENGIVPDYNEALKAKESVDEFNRGLSAIMGFDPLEAAKKSRQERTLGGRVE